MKPEKEALMLFCVVILFIFGGGVCGAGEFPGEGILVIRQYAHGIRPCMKRRVLQRKMLDAVNSARASARPCGHRRCEKTGPLTWNRKLAQAALNHSRDMALHGLFSHEGSDHSFMQDRLETAGYRPRAVGENLARGQKDVASVVRSWLGSPPHCTNMMFPDFTEMGASCMVDKNGRKYWTLILAAPF